MSSSSPFHGSDDPTARKDAGTLDPNHPCDAIEILTNFASFALEGGLYSEEVTAMVKTAMVTAEQFAMNHLGDD